MFREQLENTARTLPVVLLALGGGGGALIFIGNLVNLAGPTPAGGADRSQAWTLISLLVGALLTGYFGYLGILRYRLRRNELPPRS
jgi:hypothetical protein